MLILQTLYLALPGIVANSIPILVAKLPILRRWNMPLDFGRTWRGKRWLGDHKTVRGLVFGILAAGGTAWLQLWISQQGWLQNWELIDYTRPDLLWLGGSLGVGALLGDAVKSFFKRRAGIAPGASWFPFDQLDTTLGILIALCFFYIPPLPVVMIGLLVGPALHVASNVVAYVLGIKQVWW